MPGAATPKTSQGSQGSDHSKLQAKDTRHNIEFTSKNIQGPFGFRIVGTPQKLKWDGSELSGSPDEQLQQIKTIAGIEDDTRDDCIRALLSALSNSAPNEDELRRIRQNLTKLTGRRCDRAFYIPIESIQHYCDRIAKFFVRMKRANQALLMLQEAPHPTNVVARLYLQAFQRTATETGYTIHIQGEHTSVILLNQSLIDQGYTDQNSLVDGKNLRAAAVSVGDADSEMTFISCHTLPALWSDDNLRSTVNTLVELMQGREDKIVIAGDFNIPSAQKDKVAIAFHGKGFPVVLRQSRQRLENADQTFDMMILPSSELDKKPTERRFELVCGERVDIAKSLKAEFIRRRQAEMSQQSFRLFRRSKWSDAELNSDKVTFQQLCGHARNGSLFYSGARTKKILQDMKEDQTLGMNNTYKNMI